MIWLKRFFGGLFALILFGSFMALASSIATQRTFGNAEQVKTWLVQSKIYDKLVPAALSVAQNDNTINNGDGSITLNDKIVQRAAEETFTPQVLQQSTETFIDANYAWLNGKTPNPEFKIDLTQAKETFAQKVGKYVEERLSKLTVCTAQQQAALQIPINSLTVTCRPTNLDPKAEGARVTQELMKGDFLSNPVITQETFGRNTKDPNTKPYYKSINSAPTAYQVSKYAPFVFGGLILLSSVVIIFASPTRRQGWRRVAGIATSAGILLVISKFSTEFAINQLQKVSLDSPLVRELQGPRDFLVDKATASYTETFLIVGAVYLVVAVIIFVTAYFIGRKKSSDRGRNGKNGTGSSDKTDQDQKEEDQLPPDASTNPRLSSDDEKVINPYDNKPSNPDDTPPTGPPVIGGGSPTGKSKRPPLIQ